MKTTWKTRTAVAFTAAGVLTVGWATTVQAAPHPEPRPDSGGHHRHRRRDPHRHADPHA